MPYTMNDYRKEVALEVLDELTAEQRLRGLPPEELAKRLTPEQRLAGLPPEEIEAYLRHLRKEPKGRQNKKRNPKR